MSMMLTLEVIVLDMCVWLTFGKTRAKIRPNCQKSRDMDQQTTEVIREIGATLHRGDPVTVFDRGIVMPGDPAGFTAIPGEEISNDAIGTRRSETGPGQGPTGREGPPRRERTPSPTTKVICSGFTAIQDDQIEEVEDAYPGTRVWRTDEGIWLLSESVIVDTLGHRATFLSAIPDSDRLMPKSWGYWCNLLSCRWIGPRHTNFPDGSICAFNPNDLNWIPQDGLVALLDLYTVWATQQLHLELFRQWPGYQHAPHAYERLTEFKPDEYCGCENYKNKYGDCCMKADRQKGLAAAFREFAPFSLVNRAPPPSIEAFMNSRRSPPSMKEFVFSPMP